jgi:hypothetical protein
VTKLLPPDEIRRFDGTPNFEIFSYIWINKSEKIDRLPMVQKTKW